jgi:aerobic-type carbon monoxide dehydrogenase small subunit (CoxS/CutS family)
MLILVNGVKHDVPVEPDAPLLTVLSDELNLTGSKYGCGEGVCGACTVFIDGKPARSCIVPVSAVVGKEVTTIEGLEQNGQLHPVQEVFLQADPFQCGYCASGMIMSAVALLKSNPSPTEREIIQAMNGNICRCGNYPKIVSAIKKASQS